MGCGQVWLRFVLHPRGRQVNRPSSELRFSNPWKSLIQMVDFEVMRILLVEDEEEAARMLSKGLREQAYAVDVATTGPEGVEKAFVSNYDLIILDVMLPGMNGFAVCRELRRLEVASPVLLLTAKDEVASRIEGLDAGGDDYLTKPFDLGELSARVRALLRRGPAVRHTLYQVADLQVDARKREVQRAGRTIAMTAKEYALLEYLIRQEGAVVGRAEISEHVWDETYDPFSNLIEVYMQRLRRKIDHPGEVKLLHTRRGEGYVLGVVTSDD